VSALGSCKTLVAVSSARRNWSRTLSVSLAKLEGRYTLRSSGMTQATLRAQLPNRQGSYLLRIASAIEADLDDLARHDLANRIIAVNQTQACKG
jgi:hypothetical protein